MEVKDIRLEQIRGTAFTVRGDSDEVSQELLDSIKEHGIKQPILLRRKDDFYEVVAGMRRFAACQKLGLQTIPSILEDLDDKTAFELALTENLQPFAFRVPHHIYSAWTPLFIDRRLEAVLQ
ncbi:unnamed protein product [marine sediment metagenome]|uniref:ParB-like N-terminal domain-containing protein n=1 Tax=marine sediment metagenome TaxID=412755 RepID=X1L547_9ZZZZ